jgi:hypothetical protein
MCDLWKKWYRLKRGSAKRSDEKYFGHFIKKSNVTILELYSVCRKCARPIGREATIEDIETGVKAKDRISTTGIAGRYHKSPNRLQSRRSVTNGARNAPAAASGARLLHFSLPYLRNLKPSPGLFPVRNSKRIGFRADRTIVVETCTPTETNWFWWPGLRGTSEECLSRAYFRRGIVFAAWCAGQRIFSMSPGAH